MRSLVFLALLALPASAHAQLVAPLTTSDGRIACLQGMTGVGRVQRWEAVPDKQALGGWALSEMAGDKFIMFSRETGPSNHDNMIANFSRAGIHPRTVHQARTWLTMMAMVAEGCGVALVPSSMARAKIGGVRLVPLADDAVVAPAMLVWNPDLVAPALAKFLESAIRTLKTA